MQRLINKITTPPGGYRYVQQETGFTITAQAWSELIRSIVAHRRANNIPVGLEIEAEVQDQLCQTMPPGVCEFDRPEQSTAVKHLPQVTLAQIKQGTSTLVDWAISSRERVGIEEAERRAIICSKCHFNQPIGDCATCSQGVLRTLAEKIVGGQVVRHSESLNACQVCGCWLKAAIHLPLEILQRHQPSEQAEALPEWCWKKGSV